MRAGLRPTFIPERERGVFGDSETGREVVTAKLPHEETIRGETAKNGAFCDSEMNAIDAIVLPLCFFGEK